MSDEQSLPRFAIIRAALRETTEQLALELVSPSDAAPQWNEFEWGVARAASTMQGITTLLAARLRWTGPESWQAFVASQAELSRARDRRIGALLARIDEALRLAGVAAIGLKGAALRREMLYAAGERPMGDVDLLARPADAGAIAAMLHGLGYAEAFATARHVVYQPQVRPALTAYGEHPDNALKIEVHFVVSEALPVRHVDITSCLFPDESPPGLLGYAHLRDLMRHLLLHAAGNMRANALRQIQLHDIALLARKLEPEDWKSLAATREDRGGSWWMFPPLALAARYYPDGLSSIVKRFRHHCPPWLRAAIDRSSLTDVSWSNLRIRAFPGIAWSRSAPEALQFARSRLFPNRRAIAELHLAEAAQPALKSTQWYGIPHSHRIARWLFRRPPRAQTIVSVRAALAPP